MYQQKNIQAGDNNYFLSAYNSTSGSQFFGKKHGTDSILGGMEIQNTTLVGNYSQKVHLRTHRFGGTNGRRLTIDEKGFVGINADTPDCMFNIRDTSLHTVLKRAIILGTGSSYTTTGLNIGNSNSRPFIWSRNNSTASVNATTFTHGFGWLYRQNGNLQLIRRNGSTTNTSVMTYSRSNGCVTFTNTSPGCGSDDRLKFNETNITNALDTIMKLSPDRASARDK
jgi:hypothetical protein